jgi:hypothetical protein
MSLCRCVIVCGWQFVLGELIGGTVGGLLGRELITTDHKLTIHSKSKVRLPCVCCAQLLPELGCAVAGSVQGHRRCVMMPRPCWKGGALPRGCALTRDCTCPFVCL